MNIARGEHNHPQTAEPRALLLNAHIHTTNGQFESRSNSATITNLSARAINSFDQQPALSSFAVILMLIAATRNLMPYYGSNFQHSQKKGLKRELYICISLNTCLKGAHMIWSLSYRLIADLARRLHKIR